MGVEESHGFSTPARNGTPCSLWSWLVGCSFLWIRRVPASIRLSLTTCSWQEAAQSGWEQLHKHIYLQRCHEWNTGNICPEECLLSLGWKKSHVPNTSLPNRTCVCCLLSRSRHHTKPRILIIFHKSSFASQGVTSTTGQKSTFPKADGTLMWFPDQQKNVHLAPHAALQSFIRNSWRKFEGITSRMNAEKHCTILASTVVKSSFSLWSNANVFRDRKRKAWCSLWMKESKCSFFVHAVWQLGPLVQFPQLEP